MYELNCLSLWPVLSVAAVAAVIRQPTVQWRTLQQIRIRSNEAAVLAWSNSSSDLAGDHGQQSVQSHTLQRQGAATD
jgi:hypothetical protein